LQQRVGANRSAVSDLDAFEFNSGFRSDLLQAFTNRERRIRWRRRQLENFEVTSGLIDEISESPAGIDADPHCFPKSIGAQLAACVGHLSEAQIGQIEFMALVTIVTSKNVDKKRLLTYIAPSERI